MTQKQVRIHLVASCAVTALAGAVLLPVAATVVGGPAIWTVTGWALMALSGIAAGTWVAVEHGRSGTAFMKALVAGTLAKLFVAAGGAGAALWTGSTAPQAYLAGLAIGYVPVQLFELIWFYCVARPVSDGGPRWTGAEGSR